MKIIQGDSDSPLRLLFHESRDIDQFWDESIGGHISEAGDCVEMYFADCLGVRDVSRYLERISRHLYHGFSLAMFLNLSPDALVRFEAEWESG